MTVWIAEKLEKWKARIKTYRYAITGVNVPSGNDKTVTLEIMEQEAKTDDSKYLKLTASYPVIRGPSDATFEFSAEVFRIVFASKSESDELPNNRAFEVYFDNRLSETDACGCPSPPLSEGQAGAQAICCCRFIRFGKP